MSGLKGKTFVYLNTYTFYHIVLLYRKFKLLNDFYYSFIFYCNMFDS